MSQPNDGADGDPIARVAAAPLDPGVALAIRDPDAIVHALELVRDIAAGTAESRHVVEVLATMISVHAGRAPPGVIRDATLAAVAAYRARLTGQGWTDAVVAPLLLAFLPVGVTGSDLAAVIEHDRSDRADDEAELTDAQHAARHVLLYVAEWLLLALGPWPGTETEVAELGAVAEALRRVKCDGPPENPEFN
jgi:hypothetical protein